MMAFQIKEAVRRQKKGRIVLTGPSGSGKTWAGLTIAHFLAGENGKVGVIDTENGSAEMFAGEFSDDLGRPFKFQTIELGPPFTPERYIEAFDQLVTAGFDAILTDSTTHEWDGSGGCLEIHDEITDRTRNSYTAWGPVTPRHKSFLDRLIVRSPVHTVGTARAKTEYVQTKDDHGKVKIEKLGTGPIQRTQFEFEWDVLCDLNLDHTLFVTKSRVRTVDGKTYRKDLKSFCSSLKEYLDGGAEPLPPTISISDMKALVEFGKEHNKTPDEIKKIAADEFGKEVRDLTVTELDKLKEAIKFVS